MEPPVNLSGGSLYAGFKMKEKPKKMWNIFYKFGLL